MTLSLSALVAIVLVALVIGCLCGLTIAAWRMARFYRRLADELGKISIAAAAPRAEAPRERHVIVDRLGVVRPQTTRELVADRVRQSERLRRIREVGAS